LIIRPLHIFFLLISFSSFAQQNECSDPAVGLGDMKLTSGNAVGCVPMKINVANNQLTAKNPTYIYDYKVGPPPTGEISPTHTFDIPGSHVVMQRSYRISDGKELRFCLQITVRDTIPPPFEVKSCSNRTASITILPAKSKYGEDMKYDKYLIDWGDNSAIGEVYSVYSSASHTYVDAQSRKITVRGWYKDVPCGGSTFQTIKFSSEPPTPAIQKVTSLDANTIELKIENKSGVEYKVLKNESGFSFQPTGLTNKGSENIQIATNTSKNVCFKLESSDACAAFQPSNIACNANFQILPDADANNLKWEMNSAQSLVVLKDGKEISAINAVIDAAKTDGFADKNIKCHQQYCYLMIAQRGEYEAISVVQCVKNNQIPCFSLLTPIFIPDAFTPNGDGVNDELELKGDASYFIKFQIYDRWGNPITVFQDFKTKWKAENYPSGDYIYRLDAKDKEGNEVNRIGVIKVIR
jgi:gliding motility-associated-like protein